MRRRALGGLLVRREAWGLSLYGKLLLLAVVSSGAWACLGNLYGFLDVRSPVSSRILVVDGWLPTYDLRKAADQYRDGTYDVVLAVRGVHVLDSVELERPWDDYVAGILIRAGVPKERVHSVLFPAFQKDRTYFSAVAVGQWCREHGVPLSSLNLVTSGPHARRSRLLFEKALGDQVRVGVVGLDDPTYDAVHWWRSSEGVREVLFEGLAYLYVRCVFTAPTPSHLELI